jgi:hypothetical protein
VVLVVLLFPALAFGETMDDLVFLDGLHYKKFTDVPFTGEVTGRFQGSVKDRKLEGPWPEQARAAALGLSGVGKDDTSKGIQILTDIRKIFQKLAIKRIGSQELCDALREHDDKWGGYSHDKPLSPAQLSRLLKSYGLKSKSIRLDQGRNSKGYELEAFEEVFARYVLPDLPPENVTASQPKHTAAFGNSQGVTSSSDVTDGNGRKPAENRDCDVVTDEISELRAEGVWETEL